MNKSLKQNSAFTLIEMIGVLAIIGILAAVVAPRVIESIRDAKVTSAVASVNAAKIANEGIAAEYERGSRTTLDVIQSNSLLLSAQISLANSEKNYLMAQYNLLKAVGLLNSQYLKLK